mmetsp:Transcript_315/g.1054  ORF Transcript_315/g.1054 Transcript_315/m.1054 type:complete len:218 (-) Transcript_315:145-798(-)
MPGHGSAAASGSAGAATPTEAVPAGRAGAQKLGLNEGEASPTAGSATGGEPATSRSPRSSSVCRRSLMMWFSSCACTELMPRAEWCRFWSSTKRRRYSFSSAWRSSTDLSLNSWSARRRSSLCSRSVAIWPPSFRSCSSSRSRLRCSWSCCLVVSSSFRVKETSLRVAPSRALVTSCSCFFALTASCSSRPAPASHSRTEARAWQRSPSADSRRSFV